MSLSSFSYILFLPLVTGINFILPRKYRYLWLFTASCFFYLSGDMRFGIALVFCAATTYVAGLLLEKGNSLSRKIVLASCIILNLLMLLLFRYSPIKNLFVPLGISFYTLQALGYLVDIYRRETTAERNPIKYALFINFFPTVASGPIQRSKGLLQQIREGCDFNERKARSGLYYLLWGYLLKLFVANRLAHMVDFAYDDYTTLPGAALLWASVLYSIQLYCDFAGYSALAIGTAKILGFDIPENFKQPYFSTSIRDFWNRWHISLSSWLKDYIYIPLGGSRKGTLRTCINLMITFTVSGLWHGTGLNFLVWGALHGIYQVVGKLLSGKKKEGTSAEKGFLSGICTVIKAFGTFLLVNFAWIFFRSGSLSEALAFIQRICFHFELRNMTYYGSYLLGGSKIELLLILLGICLVFLIDFLHEKHLSLEDFTLRKVPIVFRWILYIALTMLIIWVLVYDFGQSASTFIYERF